MTSCPLVPAYGWCIVRRDPPPEKTESGLVIPESVRERFTGIQETEHSTVTLVRKHPFSSMEDFEEGQQVVVLAKADCFTEYFDESNPGAMVTLGGRRSKIATLYVVREDCVVARVAPEQE